MGEYGRQVFEFRAIVSAPTLAPHLDVVALAVVVIALGLAVALVVVIALCVLGLLVLPRTVGVEARPARIASRVIRSFFRARVPSIGLLGSRA